MKPTSVKERMLSEDTLFEDDDTLNELDDEKLKIEALKIATNIGKLMSGVTPDDIVNIAETVANFIKNGDTSASLDNESSDEEDNVDSEEEFNTDDTDDTENENADSEEEFEV